MCDAGTHIKFCMRSNSKTVLVPASLTAVVVHPDESRSTRRESSTCLLLWGFVMPAIQSSSKAPVIDDSTWLDSGCDQRLRRFNLQIYLELISILVKVHEDKIPFQYFFFFCLFWFCLSPLSSNCRHQQPTEIYDRHTASVVAPAVQAAAGRGMGICGGGELKSWKERTDSNSVALNLTERAQPPPIGSPSSWSRSWPAPRSSKFEQHHVGVVELDDGVLSQPPREAFFSISAPFISISRLRCLDFC